MTRPARRLLTIIGAGAIGGTVGAHMVQAGHAVVLCDADGDHVEAINRHGLQIEGPVDRFTAQIPAITPEELPDRIEQAAIAVRGHHTSAAAELLRDRLAGDGWVVSLQDGVAAATIAGSVGRARVITGVVNATAEVIAPGRISLGHVASVRVGELDADTVTARVAELADALPWAEPTDGILGYVWAKTAYAAMLWAGAVSDLSIAEHLQDARYRPLMLAVAREVLAQAPCEPRAFDGFDPSDLEGTLDRLAAVHHGLPLSHSRVYRDLMIRGRRTEVAALSQHLRGPITTWVADLIASIEAGDRTCEAANLDLLVALERADRLGRGLGAVVQLIAAPTRAASGPLHGVPVAVKDLIAVRDTPTGNGNPTDMAAPPADEDAEIVARLRAAGADVFATTALLEYAAGGLHPEVPETHSPWDPSRTASGSSGGSAALVGCGACAVAIGTDTGGSIRLPAHCCGTVGFKPTHGALPTTGVTPLARSLDHVGLLTSDVSWAARAWTACSGKTVPARGEPLRLGVLAGQLKHRSLEPGVARALAAALDRLRDRTDLVAELVDVDDTPFRAVDGPFSAILGWETWQQLGPLVERDPVHLGPETVRLLQRLSKVSPEEYRHALAERVELTADCMRAYAGVDALVSPAAPFVPPSTTPATDNEDWVEAGMFTRAYNLTGAPALVLPCGWTDGLPVGLQLSAPFGQDGALLVVAATVEEALAFERPDVPWVELPAPAAGWAVLS